MYIIYMYICTNISVTEVFLWYLAPFLHNPSYSLYIFPSPLSLSGTQTVLHRGGSKGANTPALAAAVAAGSVV